MADQPGPPKAPKQRVVRMFVSSTFRDMQEERDYLATQVFPDLRDRCRKRRVEFVEVDLRWGINEEQSQRGEVLPICLAEIENCRPYFIGLLGERYGWVPKKIDSELINEQPWLKEHLEKSVTELEILHGVLLTPPMKERSFFYFRDPTYISTVAEDRRPDLVTEDPQSRAKLEKLKTQIRKSGLPVRENYPDPQAAGELIRADLWNAIDEEFPEVQLPDALDQEAAEHEAFAQTRSKIYIPREEYYQRLDEHVATEEGPPLCLVGESGGGKSALLANWAFRYREKHPDTFLIMHFIGSSSGSADYVSIIRRIMGEIKRRYDLPDEVPETPEKIREAFPLWLASASAKDGVILILDALNQLEDRDNAPHLGWLPDYIPSKVRLIVSTLGGPAMDAINKREWPKLEVEPMRPDEVQVLTVKYLDQYVKTLEPEHLKLIVASKETTNPLYLRALLEELRIFGIREELDDRINHYLEAKTIPDLYDRILARLEKDYEKERKGLVGDAMSCLWASRRGLFESELLDLLGDSDQPLPRAVWSPLFFGIEESLVDRSGLLNFFHDYLRQAVQQRYLADEESRIHRHVLLGEYFGRRETDDRKSDELPWQWQSAGEWERLKDSITDLAMFHRLRTEAKLYELMGYWLELGDRFDMVNEYGSALAAYEATKPTDNDLAFSLHEVAYLFYLSAHFYAAEPLHKRSLAIREKALGPEHPDVAASLRNLALLHDYQGRHSVAEPLYKRSVAIYEKALGPEHPEVATSLNNLAGLYYSQGRYAEAEHMCKRSLAIREKALGPEHLHTATSLYSLALLYHDQRRYAEAAPLYQQSVAAYEKALGPEHSHTRKTVSILAAVLSALGDDAELAQLRKRYPGVISDGEQADGADPITQAFKQALALRDSGAHEQAAEIFRQFIAAYDNITGSSETPPPVAFMRKVAICHNELAFHTHVPAKSWDEAELHFSKAVELMKQVGDQVEVANMELNLQKLVHLSGKQVDREKVRELTKILEEAGDQRAQKGRELLKELDQA